MTLGLGGTPECLRAPTPSLVFSSLWVIRLVMIKEVAAVVIVKMMLMMMKMVKMMAMMVMFSPPMALRQQRRASTKVL